VEASTKMSNVLYVCPDENCGARLFDAPKPGGIGSKNKMKCHVHTELNYVQAEDYEGPDFGYVDPDQGKVAGTGVRTDPALRNVKTVNKVVKEREKSHSERMAFLRDRYHKLYGKLPDMRLGEKKLTMYVAKKEEENNAAVRAEFAQARGELVSDEEE
jgi:hypothetical protein